MKGEEIMARTFIAVSAAVLLLIGVFTASAGAVNYPGGLYVGGGRADITYLTFSGPVRVPGATLAAGTYEFRRISPRVIQVVSRDHSTVYAMFRTVARWRVQVGHQDEMVFGEAPTGTARPVSVWFPAHLLVGDEFVYPTATSASQVALK